MQQGTAAGVSTHAKQVLLADGHQLPYDKICICTGAHPKAVAENPHVVVLRDQDTIEALADRLPGMRRVVLVGNGGIALEIAHALSGLEVIWVVKHKHIGDAFFDLDAAAFLCTQLPSASSTPHDSAAPKHSASPAATSQIPPSHSSPTQQLADSQPGKSHSQTSLPNTSDLPSEVGPKTAAQGSAAQQSTLQDSAAQLPGTRDSVGRESGGGAAAAESHERPEAAAACGEALPQRSRHRQRRGRGADRGHLPEAKGQGVGAAGSSGSLPAKPTIQAQQVKCPFTYEYGNE